ncbi:intraflagellar transport protein 43 homolog A-like isoform X1 [Amphibalanus amphitrite]|uniref:intraflagellar transport protein 43 homolog A-like isoform X1 n=1 Tax=Amphibalanus amphitrite TaxID=1232801 RepID=UPI001C91EB42|nr:intraflagellar transport protein 43 homolog A-like isoform X1 [Amphibalanus amphitrite]
MGDPLDDLDDILSSPQSRPRTSYLAPSSEPRPATSAPPRPRQEVTGWGDAPPPGSPAPAPGPPVGRRQRSGFQDPATTSSAPESKPLAKPRPATWDDEDAVLPMIPDLEEVQEEDLALQVAAAPRARVNRVVTMQELNDDLFKHPTFMALEDIDLRLLTRALTEPADVQEPDRPWVWDVLFTEVLSEVQQDEDSDDGAVDLPTPKSRASARGRRAASGRLPNSAKPRGQPAGL